MALTPCSRYFQERRIDPDTIWIGLCEGDEKATAWSKAFFSDYVEHSVRRVIVLGPEEYVDRRMLNSASILAMWRKLVKEAYQTVLKQSDNKNPGQATNGGFDFMATTLDCLRPRLLYSKYPEWVPCRG
jgi:hypothetical protein